MQRRANGSSRGGTSKAHKLQQGRSSVQLRRLEDNEKILLEVRDLLVESLRSAKTITPAAEWLLDNFYLVEEQVVLARKHLPKVHGPSVKAAVHIIQLSIWSRAGFYVGVHYSYHVYWLYWLYRLLPCSTFRTPMCNTFAF